jgi:hypothetical protein
VYAPTSQAFYQASGVQGVQGGTTEVVQEQISADYLSDRKLETYTGGASKLANKADPPVMFSPEVNVYSTQSAFDSAYKRFEDVQNEKVVFNNMSPIEQTRVGPGMGLGYFETSRDTGFHDMFRIYPGNVNGYRKNGEMHGRVIPGARIVQEPQMRQEDTFRANKNDLTNNAGSIEPIGARGAVHKESWYGDMSIKDTQNKHVEYTGIGKSSMERHPGDQGAVTQMRNHSFAERTGNAAMSLDSGYATSRFLDSPNQRSEDGAFPILGGYSRTVGDVQHEYESTMTTQRGNAENGVVLAGASPYEQTKSRDDRIEQKTQRGQGSDATLLAGKGSNTRFMSPAVQVYGTHRDTTVEVVGNPGKTRNGQYESQFPSFDSLNENKPTVSNMPHPGRQNVVTYEQFGESRVKDDNRVSRDPTGARGSLTTVERKQMGDYDHRVEYDPDTLLKDRVEAFETIGEKDLSKDVSRFPEMW